MICSGLVGELIPDGKDRVPLQAADVLCLFTEVPRGNLDDKNIRRYKVIALRKGTRLNLTNSDITKLWTAIIGVERKKNSVSNEYRKVNTTGNAILRANPKSVKAESRERNRKPSGGENDSLGDTNREVHCCGDTEVQPDSSFLDCYCKLFICKELIGCPPPQGFMPHTAHTLCQDLHVDTPFNTPQKSSLQHGLRPRKPI
jgi:hypothetical protein